MLTTLTLSARLVLGTTAAAGDGKYRFAQNGAPPFRIRYIYTFGLLAGPSARNHDHSPIYPAYGTSASGSGATQRQGSRAGTTASLLPTLSATSAPTRLLVAPGSAYYVMHSLDQRKQGGHPNDWAVQSMGRGRATLLRSHSPLRLG